jgi:hexosaminidase
MSAIIPAPLRVSPHGCEFAIDGSAVIVVTDPSLRFLAEGFAVDLRADTGIALEVRDRAAEENRTILLELSDDDAELDRFDEVLGLSPHGGDPAAERYGLDVGARSVRIWAAAEEGLFRGLTTLRQLAGAAAPSAPGTRLIPGQRIIDSPRFAWRGLSLDVARTFFPVQQVEQVIDILAAYKMNVLHLHLTDDAGWRLDIPGKPRLATVGGQHAHGDRPGGWYSTADFARLVRYGAQRYVTLVPEIDLPGHVTALLRAYPELTANGTAPEPTAEPALRPSALDLGIDGTAEFVADVLSEVAALVPTPFLHIGGDEAFGMPHAVFSAFIEHATATARMLGKQPVGWQETARAATGADVVQYWFDRADELGSIDPVMLAELGIPADLLPVLAEQFAAAGQDVGKAVRKGAKILLSPSRYTYLDVPYAEPSSDPVQEETRQRVGMPLYPRATIRDSLAWDPESLLAGTVPVQSLAGIEAALWSETVTDIADAHFLLLPRLPGIAEKAWSPSGQDWDGYRERLAVHGRLWEHRGWGFFRSSLIDWADSHPSEGGA